MHRVVQPELLFLLLALSGCRTPAPAAPPPPHGHAHAGAIVRDVDGDDYDDAIVGRDVLRFGGPHGLSGDRTLTIPDPGRDPALFSTVALVGDVDGDGHADVMLGDPGCPRYAKDMPACDVGHAYLFLGTRDGIAPTPATTITATATDTLLGNAMLPLGDVDGDGHADVALLARDALHVYLGGPGGLREPSIDLPPREAEAVGDLDGDGKDELLLVEPRGATLHRAGPPFHTRLVAIPADAEVYGMAAGGDFDGDGFDDLALTVEPQDARGDLLPQQVLVYRGGPDGPAATPSVTLTQDGPEAEFGGTVVAPGDLDGDGYGDLAVASTCAVQTDGACDGVRAYVFRGGPHGLATTPSRTLEPGHSDTGPGLTLQALGDVDGDGHPDLGFGVFVYSAGATATPLQR
jgi:hypothetical protein